MNYLLTTYYGFGMYAVVDLSNEAELFTGSYEDCNKVLDALREETIETAEATEIEAEFVTDEDYAAAY